MDIIEPHAASTQISIARIMVSSVEAKKRQMDFMRLKIAYSEMLCYSKGN